jgi:hypothetical protein
VAFEENKELSWRWDLSRINILFVCITGSGKLFKEVALFCLVSDVVEGVRVSAYFFSVVFNVGSGFFSAVL